MGGPGFIQSVPDFDKLEIVVVGKGTVSSDGSATNWTTIPHNLGYRPQILAFLDNVGMTSVFTNGDVPLPSFTSLSIDPVSHVVTFGTYVLAACDETNVYLIMFNGLGTTLSSYPIKYYLLRERSS